ncbi:hypothetical protein ES703_98583 [subsurface metagenome]
MSDVHDSPHGFRRFFCDSCGTAIDVPIHCSSKACPVCTRIRRWRIRERIFYALQGLVPQGNCRWRHIVLTVKNGTDLGERLDHLVKSFRNIRHRQLWKRTQYGGFYTIEITEGVDGWHPHLHIVSYGSFIPWRKLLAAWCQVTKDSRHIRVSTIQDGVNIAYYISKYITKIDTLSSTSTMILDLVCKNRRLFGPFGKAAELMKRYKPPDKFAICQKCGSHNWVPEFILEMQKRQAACHR